MPHDLMTKCQKKKLFMRGENKVWEWVEVEVSSIISGARGDIRCMHCYGAVRVHKQQVEHGPVDHVEHRDRQDSEHCKGGIYFQGVHRISINPVS